MLTLLLALALQAPTAPLATPRSPAAQASPSQDPLRGDWSKPSGKRVTLSGSMSVDAALERIADAGGWNLVLNTGTGGARTATFRLRDVAVEDALRAALTGSPLVATRTGNLVAVSEGAEAASAATLTGFDPPTGKRFTGELEDEDVDEALKRIAASAGLSIVLPQGDLEASITASFQDVPVEDALRAVLTQGGLTAERQGELVVVRRARAARDASAAARSAGSYGDRDRDATGSDLTIAPGDDARDVNVVRGSLKVAAGASVRDANAVMGDLTLESGAAARDVAAVLGNATLGSGASAREVVAVMGNVEIGPGAEVDQDVVSVGGRVHVDPTAHVGGSTHSIVLPSLPRLSGKTIHVLPDIPTPITFFFWTLVRFAVLFVLGLVVLAVAPRRLEAVSSALVARPWWSLLAGLLGSLGAVLLALLLVATVVGALLVPVEILLILAGWVLGITALTYYLGRLLPLPPSRRTRVLELAIGTLIFSVAAAVPILSVMVWVASWFLAFGAVVRTRFGQPPAAPLPTVPAPPATT